MADDVGNADFGYRGGIKTPNMNKLANEGVRLESFYGEPICTPSRGADDRPLSNSLRAADARHFPQPHLWTGDGRAHGQPLMSITDNK